MLPYLAVELPFTTDRERQWKMGRQVYVDIDVLLLCTVTPWTNVIIFLFICLLRDSISTHLIVLP